MRAAGAGSGTDAPFATPLESVLDPPDQPQEFGPNPVDRATWAGLVDRASGGLRGDGEAPWRVFDVSAASRREAVRWNFEVCNGDVLARADARHARTVDLAALRDAPAQHAVFADTDAGGRDAPDRRSARNLAVVTAAAACERIRLCAGAAGLRVRWLFAFDAAALAHALGAPERYAFVGYLCVGYPPARPE